MSKFIESYKAAKSRINPEGLLVSSAITATSNMVMIPMEVGITYAIHETSIITDPNLLKLFAIGIIGIANAASVKIQAKALEAKQYSASPVASTLNIMTGKSLLSSAAEHGFTYGVLNTLNPISATAIATGDSELLIDSIAATTMTYPIWAILNNSLILSDRIDPVINKMRNVRKGFSRRLRG